MQYLFFQKGHDVYHYDIKIRPEQDASKENLFLEKYDVIVFLAWDVGGSNYLYRKDTQLKQMHDNLELLKNVFSQYERIDRNKTKIIFMSTQLSEKCDTVYGVTKRLGEVWGSMVGGLSFRLWNVYD